MRFNTLFAAAAAAALFPTSLATSECATKITKSLGDLTAEFKALVGPVADLKAGFSASVGGQLSAGGVTACSVRSFSY